MWGVGRDIDGTIQNSDLLHYFTRQLDSPKCVNQVVTDRSYRRTASKASISLSSYCIITFLLSGVRFTSHMSRGVSMEMAAIGRVADAPAALPRDLCVGLECG